MPAQRTWWQYIGVVSLAGVLAAVALLQYRWVGQLAADRATILKSQLDVSVEMFRRSFLFELVETANSLRVEPRPGRTAQDQEGSIAEQFARWRAMSAHPEVVRALYLERDGAWRKYDEKEARFTAAEPPGLAGLIAECAPHPPSWHGPDRAPFQPFWRMVFSGGHLYLLRPALLQPYSQPPRGPNAHVAVELHRTFLFESLAPEIAERAFGGNEATPYDLAILENGGGKSTLVFGPETLLTDRRAPDVRVDLLIDRGGPPPPPLERGRGGRGGRGRGFLFAPCGDVAGWELIVRHQAGSLTEEVRGYRARNLALSGAVLALLTCSFLLLAIATGRAHKLAQMQLDFTAGVSHELRTPVAVIHSAADNLADGAVSGADSVAEYGRLIQRECRRLTGMVEETLQYAAVRSGRRRLEIQPVDAAAAVREALRQTRPILAEAGMTVDENIAGGLPLALADPAHLTRSVQNLLTNAAKYAAAGGWAGVRVWSGERAGRPRIFIQVSDRGPGIAARDLPLIFDPFYQGQSEGGVKGQGVGLGLSLARDIIRAMDGEISVDSAPGQGAVFTIDLPGAAA